MSLLFVAWAPPSLARAESLCPQGAPAEIYDIRTRNRGQSIERVYNASKARSSLLSYLSQAESQGLDRLPSDLEIMRDRWREYIAQKRSVVQNQMFRAQDCASGQTEYTSLRTEVEFAKTQGTTASRILASIGNLRPNASPEHTLPVPDPTAPLDLGIRNVKMANGSEPPGNSRAEKLRAVLAERFERMARVFIGGSEQLRIDTGTPYGGAGAPMIKGMYQGFWPDLVNSTPERIYYTNEEPTWAGCGVANMENAANRRFKSANGDYTNERIQSGNVYSHEAGCLGGRSLSSRGERAEFAYGRGQIVELYFKAMDKVLEDLRQGRIIAPRAYSGVGGDPCIETAASIIAGRRNLFRKSETENFSPAELEQWSRAECGTSSGPTVPDQMRACHRASMQVEIEQIGTLFYAYCTWRTIANHLGKEYMRVVFQ